MTSGGDGQDQDNNPWGQNPDMDNVIPLAERRKIKDARQKAEQKKPVPSRGPPHGPSEPMINLPPYTKYLLAGIVIVHLIIQFVLTEDQMHWVFLNLGFTPGSFTGSASFEPLTLLTPFTHMFIHGGWLHLGMNSIMLVAFGSGVERWIGGQKMLLLFVGCCLFGAAAHLALNYSSVYPVVGASGGISGLFAAALIMLNRNNASMSGKFGLWPLIILWIGISVVFGYMGGPDGSDIAWAAHVGGFLGAFPLMKLMRI